jgi:hypothetical protein
MHRKLRSGAWLEHPVNTVAACGSKTAGRHCPNLIGGHPTMLIGTKSRRQIGSSHRADNGMRDVVFRILFNIFGNAPAWTACSPVFFKIAHPLRRRLPNAIRRSGAPPGRRLPSNLDSFIRGRINYQRRLATVF